MAGFVLNAGEGVVLASANPKKVAEIAEILGGALELVPRPSDVPEVIEDADTFEGNARLKAVALAAATGMVALADDSGLEVDALGGAPGVRSARFAGEHPSDAENVNALLAALDALDARAAADAPVDRSARFRCTLVLRAPDGTELVADGTVEGAISRVPRGHAGFGYDPVFVPTEGTGATFAEMSASAKHAISHRGRALRALAAHLARGELDRA